MQKKHDQLVDRNRELAVANLELEPRFTECKETLTDLHTKAAEIQREYKTKFEELSKLCKSRDQANVYSMSWPVFNIRREGGGGVYSSPSHKATQVNIIKWLFFGCRILFFPDSTSDSVQGPAASCENIRGSL